MMKKKKKLAGEHEWNLLNTREIAKSRVLPNITESRVLQKKAKSSLLQIENQARPRMLNLPEYEAAESAQVTLVCYVHPKPYILHPTPYTHTLHPTPFTPHPTP